MGYRTLSACLHDLESTGQLLRIEQEIDPHLEAAEIQRRVFQAGGPAIYFARVKGCAFPMASNLFGTMDRVRFIFRDTLETVKRLVALKVEPGLALKQPLGCAGLLATLWHMRPKYVSRGAVLAEQITIDRLPPLQCWPDDGGPFITLPQVYTEDPDRPGWQRSNLGMYRVQLSGGQYQTNAEVGLHYQIHRGIGVHHAAAVRRGEPLRVNVFVGGAPAMSVAAVMPLPEGLSELSFAGALAGHRIPLVAHDGQLPVYAEADFCISGTVDPSRTLPEGPFGDHLGYYSLVHEFPVLKVDRVWHRQGAVWPFTVVGRPPQEDTLFGELIHELTGPAIPSVIPGLHAVHAVDAAGVHPLLLAIGSERYTPYAEHRQPQELLTMANAILGQGQLSLAKYLWIAAREDDPALDIHDIAAFLVHMLSRADWTRDLHFQTRTTMDTLDYSGGAINEGSKLVIAAAGPPIRTLPTKIGEWSLPEGFGHPHVCLPGVLAIEGPRYSGSSSGTLPGGSGGVNTAVEWLCSELSPSHPINRFPLVVVTDDVEFAARSLNNFLWVTFTRSNPAADVQGIGAFIEQKHWGCRGSLVIDARGKPHHAPPLIEDAEVTRRVDALAARGGPLAGIL
jgi:4-hydroxy-3-polyprenylbenzoate decarboxylase